MDDFNTSVLSEAKNEYSSRLVTILTPLIIEGIKSIFKEAFDLCNKNDENTKYLMTFQNFLTRIPRWNQQIINDETTRILQRSGCSYLEDILTCVHITQLKILTSIRVSSKQKKVNIDIPKLPDFIHKIYIECARKIYENVYLFEANIQPLQQQKNMRECEIICQESILNVIRSSMPIEKILRAYIDEIEEEEVVQETVKETSTDTPSDTTKNATTETKSTNNISTDNKSVSDAKSEDIKSVSDVKSEDVKSEDIKSVSDVKSEDVKSEDVKSEEGDSAISSTLSEPNTSLFDKNPIAVSMELGENDEDAGVADTIAKKKPEVSPSFNITTEMSKPLEKELSDAPSKLSFSPNDNVIQYNNTDKVTQIKADDSKQLSAPKTLDRLEAISKLRHEQRKIEDEAEEDDGEDSITIHKDAPSIKLDSLDIQVLDDNLQLKTPPLLTGVETL